MTRTVCGQSMTMTMTVPLCIWSPVELIKLTSTYGTVHRGSGPARRQPVEQVGHISLLISSDGSTHCRQIPVSRSRDSHKSDEPIYLLTYTQWRQLITALRCIGFQFPALSFSSTWCSIIAFLFSLFSYLGTFLFTIFLSSQTWVINSRVHRRSFWPTTTTSLTHRPTYIPLD